MNGPINMVLKWRMGVGEHAILFKSVDIVNELRFYIMPIKKEFN